MEKSSDRKVAFFLTNYSLSGGTERSCIGVVNGLAKSNKYEITLIVCNKKKEKSFFAIDENVKIEFLEVENFKKDFLLFLYRLFNLFKKNKYNFIIAVEMYSLLFLLLPYLFNFRRKTKLIAWEHFNYTVDLGRNLRRVARKIAMKFCSTIVVLTQRDKMLWEFNGAKEGKLYVINNFSPFIISTKGYNIKSKTIIAVGRLSYQKGFDKLMNIWKEFIRITDVKDDWKLQVIGDGEKYEELRDFIVMNQLEDSVFLTGNVSNISDYYLNASFLVMTSRFEGLPMTLLEAQSFGLPIIAFDCLTGPSEVVNERNGFLIKEEDDCGFVSSIARLISDVELRENMGLQAKIDVERFSEENIIKRWEDLLNKFEY